MYSKILVPVTMKDPEGAAKAIDIAVGLAKTFNSQVMAITLDDAGLDGTKPVPDDAATRFKYFIEQQSDLVGLPLSGTFRKSDDLTGEIRDAVDEFGIDLVVMRSHDPTLLDYLMGSRSSSVALHVPCSVLVAR